MGNVKGSSPSKKSKNLRPAGSKLGYLLAGGLMVTAVAIIATALLLGFSNIFAGNQLVITAINDTTSPEALRERREQAEAQLNSYGWVDKENGVVRLPIERAMVLIAESNLPVGIPTPTEVPPTPTPEPTATPVPTIAGETATPTPEPTPTIPPSPTVDLANVSFSQKVLPILEENCVRCHGGEQPKEGLTLSDYDSILAGSWNGPVIEPGNVEDSYLIEQIVSGRMPKEGGLLSPEAIEIITAWVEAGALNN